MLVSSIHIGCKVSMLVEMSVLGLKHPCWVGGWLVQVICHSSFHSVHSRNYMIIHYYARRKDFAVCGIRVVSGEERVKGICDVPLEPCFPPSNLSHISLC